MSCNTAIHWQIRLLILPSTQFEPRGERAITVDFRDGESREDLYLSILNQGGFKFQVQRQALQVQETLLRISGAIQVLTELLEKDASETQNGVHVPESATSGA